MKFNHFIETLADVVDTNSTHVISFELRKLNPSERTELSSYLRTLAKESQK